MIENKWKRFAVSQTLSDWGDIDPSDLFDLMTVENEEGLSNLFDQYDVLVWDRFEDMPYREVADHIESLAQAANETANYE